MDRNLNLHYHIRWSGRVELDWEPFGTRAEAESGAKELVRLGETYTVEQYDATCLRCAGVVKMKSTTSASKSL
jgi:hypothetical protein